MSNVFTDPASWGPPAWVFLHCVTWTFPIQPTPQERNHYRRFFRSLGNVLPCKKCRKEYVAWLRTNPIEPHLGSRQELSDWLIRLHNNVNLRNNKDILKEKECIREIKAECKKFQKKKSK